MSAEIWHFIWLAVGLGVGAAAAFALARSRQNNPPGMALAPLPTAPAVDPAALQSALADHLLKVTEKLAEADARRAGQQQEFRTLMDLLRAETGQLGRALRAPQPRGAWGEVVLERVLELSGLVKDQHYATQVALGAAQDHLRPDVVVYLPGKLSVVIDAKVPLSAFLDAQDDARSDVDRAAAFTRHAQQLKTHITELGSKNYWDRIRTLSPEFVVLFVPSEGMLSAALNTDPALFELAAKCRVTLASPMNLIGLLRTVAFGWRQEDVSENARQIAELGKKLYEAVQTFSKHYEDLGKKLSTTVEAYNKSVGSIETTFLPTARKLKDMQVVDALARPIAEIVPIDIAARTPSKPEMLLRTGTND